MHTFLAHFIADEPLIITDGTTEGMGHCCLSHVPGNMLLGAFATVWKRTHGGRSDGDPEFEALFLRGNVRWGHAVPACCGRPCLPVPRSWEYIKSEGALPCYGSKSEKPRRIWNLLRAPDRNAPPKDDMERRWKDINDNGIKHKRVPEGFVDAVSCCAPDIRHIQTTHVALDPEQRRAQDGFLFAYEALDRRTRFASLIICDDVYAEAVRTLLGKGCVIQVGHSRSAGYGSLRLERLEEGAVCETKVTSGEHLILLQSDYFPLLSWKTPLEAFLEELGKTCTNVRLNRKKTFSGNVRLEGFNTMWKAPRPSRHGIAAGSVLTFETAGGTLPFALGGWQQEGYGRILCDTELLRPLLITPKDENNEKVENTTVSSEGSWPFLSVWRHRSLERLAKEQAIQAIWGETCWDGFFKNLNDGKPSQSQRGNIRRMISSGLSDDWATTFQQMLEKTPGRQWKAAITFSPFNNRRESLGDIVLELLDRGKTDELLASQIEVWSLPSLPGGPLTQLEKNFFQSARHQRMLLELLRRWEKNVRGGK